MPQQTQQTQIDVTPDERDAMDFIKSVRPEMQTDASVRRTAIFEFARMLGWRSSDAQSGKASKNLSRKK